MCSKPNRLDCFSVLGSPFILAALAWYGLLVAPLRAQGARTEGISAVESGKFRLHKFEQPIGEETYEIARQGDSLIAKISFKFTDRGTEVPLTASFRGGLDLTPQAFEIKGKTSRDTDIDQAVEIEGARLRVRIRETWTEAASPAQFFTLAGYSPAAMQMLMLRYWARHGWPAELATYPRGKVRIERRGQDSIVVNGETKTFSRFTIEGVIWGRETLWFDEQEKLVAEISVDAEFDHFEAIRDEDENALAAFVARAGTDNMAALVDLARAATPAKPTKTLALVGGTLIDGTGRPAIQDATVLINQGRIAAAGQRSKIKIPKAAVILDTHGKTILPGLWDMHAHFEQVEWGPVYLAAGVTTVRDCGNEFEFITTVRDAIAQGRGVGPRILAAGIVDGSGKMSMGVQRVDTPEQARMWVDRYHAAGFQQIKIYSSVKLEQIKAITAEAHRLHMTVTGHVPDSLNAYQVIEAGQDQINHVSYIADIMHARLALDATGDDELNADAAVNVNSPEAQKALSFFKLHHTVIDPTLAIFEFLAATTAKPTSSFEPGVTKVPPEMAQQLTDVDAPSERSAVMEKAFEADLRIVGALHRAGIPVVAGTDQTVPGYSLHREIELYVQAGFTPMEAIQAATIVPARVMGLDREVGTVERGKRADVIVVSGNPLDDIRNTRKVEYVITNGVMSNSADLWRSVGFQP
jgi:imidazolonepropionase-like amidohydrolase